MLSTSDDMKKLVVIYQNFFFFKSPLIGLNHWQLWDFNLIVLQTKYMFVMKMQKCLSFGMRTEEKPLDI